MRLNMYSKVSAPHETLRTLKLEDHPEWTIGDKDRLIVLGSRHLQ
jgi:hypothetical protein